MIRFTEGNHARLSEIEIKLRSLIAAKKGGDESGDLAGGDSTFAEQLEIINGFCS